MIDRFKKIVKILLPEYFTLAGKVGYRGKDLRNLERLLKKERFLEGQLGMRDWVFCYVDAVSTYFQVVEIFGKRIYDFKMTRKGDPVIIDAGANVGLATLRWLEIFEKPRICCYEADQKVFSTLSKNIGEVENVAIHNKAVWVSDEGVQFHSEGADAGAVIDDPSGTESSLIPSLRLKDVIDELGHVDLLKMDIEGSEAEVLMDCAGSIKKVDRLFFEFHSIVDEKQRLGELLGMLEGFGFEYHIVDEFVSDAPFSKLNESYGMNMRLNVFCWKKGDGKQ